MSIADPNKTIVIGENPFIRLSAADGDPNSTEASFWRVFWSPAGAGHVLYMKSELTADAWRIWSDNIAMTRWLQNTVQGMLNPALADTSLAVTEASFHQPEGDPRISWTERLSAYDEEISLTWTDIGDPLLLHTLPHQVPGRQYGLCTQLIPALETRLTLNGVQAKGRSWAREREGRPFSTSALAFAESWTEARG